MRVHLTRRLVLAALFVSLTAVFAQIQLPLPGVPVSLSLLSVLLCGALLGARWGALSMAAYVLLGVIGVPVYAGFLSGPSSLFGPTGGFIAGYILCAWIVGKLCAALGFSRKTLSLSMAAGVLACYMSGSLWFMLVTHTELAVALSACVLPFLPGDALKIALAAHLARRVQSVVRGLDA